MQRAVAFLALVAGALAFAPAREPLGLRRAVALSAKASIQFYKGQDEPDIPDVKLTRSVDASTGVAKFRFAEPSFFQEENADNYETLFDSMTLIDEEGEMSTNKVDASFVNGKPKSIEATLEMVNPGEWDRFMRFMERYAEANGLGFTSAS